MSDELLPCPCCSSDQLETLVHPDKSLLNRVRCLSCLLTGFRCSWNRRAPVAAVTNDDKAVRQALVNQVRDGIANFLAHELRNRMYSLGEFIECIRCVGIDPDVLAPVTARPAAQANDYVALMTTEEPFRVVLRETFETAIPKSARSAFSVKLYPPGAQQASDAEDAARWRKQRHAAIHVNEETADRLISHEMLDAVEAAKNEEQFDAAWDAVHSALAAARQEPT